MSGFDVNPGLLGQGAFLGNTVPRFTDNVGPGGSSTIPESGGEDSIDDPAIRQRRQDFWSGVSGAIVGSIIFLVLFTWYEYLRAFFAQTFETDEPDDLATVRLFFAIFITALAIVIIYIVYKIRTTPL
jgi:hypothetical protein